MKRSDNPKGVFINGRFYTNKTIISFENGEEYACDLVNMTNTVFLPQCSAYIDSIKVGDMFNVSATFDLDEKEMEKLVEFNRVTLTEE